MSAKSKAEKVGRPSKYKPEYCQMLIDHMAKGFSFESFASVIAVNQDSLHEWAKVHSDFSEAKKEAFSKNMFYWEKKGIEGLNGEIEGFNATVWIFNMKNRHKWRDKQPDEADTIINNNNNTSNMSDEALDAKIQKLLKDKK